MMQTFSPDKDVVMLTNFKAITVKSGKNSSCGNSARRNTGL